MSLRVRLIGLVALAFFVSLALGGAIVSPIASRSVSTEMAAALLVGRQAVEHGLVDLETSNDPQRDLRNLVSSFDGNRHLRVTLTGGSETVTAAPTEERSPFGSIPAWFTRLIAVGGATDAHVAVDLHGRLDGTIAIEADPHNEILEVWTEFCESLVVLALFCGQTILLIYLFTGRALRPLDRMAVALQKVGDGDYGTRLTENLAPELARLRDSFNRMAAQLAEMDHGNRSLNEQLLTLQEQERRELARDLHDEVGPFLFAINVDVANISRLLRQGRGADIADHVQSIGDAVGHMQRQVKGMLGRLRRSGLAEIGLTEAIGNMVEFWRRRNPEIDYRVTIAPECERVSETADITLYRIVQECVSNAVRHGKPKEISISLMLSHVPGEDREEVVIDVADDGQGMSESSGAGLGLVGMTERVANVGGRLTLVNKQGGGLSVRAVLPYRPEEPRIDGHVRGAAP